METSRISQWLVVVPEELPSNEREKESERADVVQKRGLPFEVSPLKLVTGVRIVVLEETVKNTLIDCSSLIDGELETEPGLGWHHVTAVKGFKDEIGHI